MKLSVFKKMKFNKIKFKRMKIKFLKKFKSKRMTRVDTKGYRHEEEIFPKELEVLDLKFTQEDGKNVAEELGISFENSKYTLEEFTYGMNMELEHGCTNPETNITNDDPLLTGKIALAHLNEYPDYYIRLRNLELNAKQYWEGKDKTK